MPAGRYAPSPTGSLHLGNLRTALVAWLAARATDRAFLLRVEDLDRVRSGAEADQRADLAAVGLDWDAEPVRQSERTALYDAAVAALRAAHGTDAVYECFCSRKDIAEATSAPHPRPDDGAPASGGTVPLRPPGFYPGTCRGLTEAERAERRRVRPAALRIDAAKVAGLPAGETPRATAVDVLHGEVTGLVDDLVLRRNDGAYAYNLAVVVDDLAQGVDQVVRGDDLLDSAPRQRWLAEALCAARGEPTPAVEYLHVPLVLNTEGRRLAKRDGAVTLKDLAAQDPAWTPERVRDRLLESLGLPAGPLAAAVPAFDPAALPRVPWVFTGL
ncbi:tRNA glutamyl-Q(34) synthetase GluQRS [Micrococcus luteus]|uniref:tRNA glutamyl-Q(34) synthetase GluQRS n=1 Tax=Micrococcus luteus TaxID=1270 RepID=UPI0029D7BEE4|nr:tRNA glutamyl-Q(34) synthetase GluQRS [Micrococcus luteus]MCV7593305.1 tRNA glutamyl-Q(34) synthetase GluQRS [Micrococcus luteus]MCV7621734.1 tRNA glutamyl-Q(34) synthetase GluQRS [Micrococcus luteus]